MDGCPVKLPFVVDDALVIDLIDMLVDEAGAAKTAL